MHNSVNWYFCFKIILAGFVDTFADNKEAVVNHGRKLLKVGLDNTKFSLLFLHDYRIYLFIYYL